MGSVRCVVPPRSAYLHIPFCHRRCYYCDFAVVPLGDKAGGPSAPGSASIEAYLRDLHREIALSAGGPPLATVYIGGGTPSLLSADQIADLLAQLRQHFGIQAGAELTMEMDPASFERQDLSRLLKAGINRVSLGGQSFDDAVLEQLGRRHRRHHLLDACGWLNQAFERGDLSSWSLDLIQNLPDQSLADWHQQLLQALASAAPHLSIYDLSVEPGTVMAWRQRQGLLELPEDGLAAELIEHTTITLKQAGLARYEISNYARPGHASRHNRVYWSSSGWWAFGMGATSAPWGERLARPRTRQGYREWLDDQQANGLHPSLIKAKATPLPLDDCLLVGLRCREGIDLEAQAKAAGWSETVCRDHLPALHARWQQALERGWLQRHGRRLRLTDPLGMTLSNQVLVELVLWWDALPPDVVAQSIPEEP